MKFSYPRRSRATIAISFILIVLDCYRWVKPKGADAYAKMP